MSIIHRMNIDKIERLAQEFRKGIELAKEADCFRRMTPLNIFPKGCCGDASDLLAQYYLDHNISCFRVCGTYRYNNYEKLQSHAWIEIDNNLIVDITADQFNYSSIFSNYFPPCYVGKANEFYELFMQEIHYREPFIGLEGYNDDFVRLHNLYSIIVDYI